MKIYTFTSDCGHLQADLHHDGSVDLTAPLSTGPLFRIPPEDVEDAASLLLLVAARSERMHHDIGTFPERCPFRRGGGIAFGRRCTRDLHHDDNHLFAEVEDQRASPRPDEAP